MNAFVRKEIRLLLPFWCAAMLLAIVPAWLLSNDSFDRSTDLIALTFGLGLVVLALAPFGQEFSHGTFSMLLAQPLSRRRIWWTKLGLVAGAMLLVVIAAVLSLQLRLDFIVRAVSIVNSRREFFQNGLTTGALFGFVALAGGLWTTLLLRQTAAALWFSLLIPGLLLIAVTWVLKGASDVAQLRGLRLVFGFYSLAGLVWAHRLFLRAQDSQWMGGAISLPSWSRTRSRARELPHKPSPFRTLVAKEFQAHQISLFIAFGLLMFHCATLMVRRFTMFPPNSQLRFALEAVPALWLLLPWLIGSVAVAEERKLGTHEGQLCLPVRRRHSFVAKLGVALSLGIMFGGVLPWLIEQLGVAIGVPSELARPRVSAVGGNEFATLLAFSAGITALSFFASTLMRNTLQALGVSILVVGGFYALVNWASNPNSNYAFNLWSGRLIVYIGGPVLLVLWLRLCVANYKHLHVGWNLWRRNAITILASLAFVFTTTAGIYHRTWEWFQTVEPRHGAAQLSGNVRPAIVSVILSKLLVLLPDGRLWIAGDYDYKELDEYDEYMDPAHNIQRARHRLVYPVNGTFLGGSNWTMIAGSQREIAGIQSDGSLWQIFNQDRRMRLSWTNLSVIPKPERVGADTNWIKVAGDNACILALKQDGTLWGWGNNYSGQLGPGPEDFTNGPVRIGADSDWADVFVSEEVSLGIKRDGSVWKWGRINPESEPQKRWITARHPEPVRSNLQAGDWKEAFTFQSFDLVLRKDGSVWATGFLPSNLLGAPPQYPIAGGLQRIGNESDWSEISLSNSRLFAIKKNGVLYHNEFYFHQLFWSKAYWQPSRYSDWIAVAHSWETEVALAADGTLSAWRFDHYSESLLGRSRKPVWSLNILTATK